MKQFKYLIFLTILLCSFHNIKAQKFSLSLGTDIPYQFYLGATIHTTHIDVSYRTGILVSPYSDAILNIFETMGASEIYINFLEAAYDFGWMNSIGAYYNFPEKNWYLGCEFRLDYLTAADTNTDIIEAITGRSFIRLNPLIDEQQVEFSLLMFGLGIRAGKSFHISENKKHQIKAEISLSKYLATQSFLSANNTNAEDINNTLDKLLWENVFKNYGFIGGIGIAYSYTF
jgi:hypothetical protein